MQCCFWMPIICFYKPQCPINLVLCSIARLESLEQTKAALRFKPGPLTPSSIPWNLKFPCPEKTGAGRLWVGVRAAYAGVAPAPENPSTGAGASKKPPFQTARTVGRGGLNRIPDHGTRQIA